MKYIFVTCDSKSIIRVLRSSLNSVVEEEKNGLKEEHFCPTQLK